MSARTNKLLIFDCDGVLVDSEVISLEVMCESLREIGVNIDVGEAADRFLGRSMSSVGIAIERDYGVRLKAPFVAHMREHLFARFSSELRPVADIPEALHGLRDLGFRYCVASSSQPDRIRHSLSVTELLPGFEPYIFSASMVEKGKPAPDLFLHTAHQMDCLPEHCIVVEDSAAGIRAAKAAGMEVFGFAGAAHSSSAQYRSKIEALNPDAVFDAMTELRHLVAGSRVMKDVSNA
jgi:beta-phosphoglucomutase-like phosphatase (HAD superfamily)